MYKPAVDIINKSNARRKMVGQAEWCKKLNFGGFAAEYVS